MAIACVSFFPTITYGSTTTEVEEQPHALPIATADVTQNTAGEIWQEDDREVLIRSERGAKNVAGGSGSGSGKREKNKRINNRKNSEEKIDKNEKTEKHDRLDSPVRPDRREKSHKKSRKLNFSANLGSSQI